MWECERIPGVESRGLSRAAEKESNVVQRAMKFFAEVREEMGRVSWPTREDVMGSALVVLVGVALLASYISLCDFVLSRLARLFLLR